MVRRNYIFDTIREVFRQYGYLPIETPAMENLSTLMGKYGEEGDRLLFKLLNSGDFLKDIDLQDIHDKRIGKVTSAISDKGLRYDLTVPFARFVVQHRNELTLPFKRYQVQPVWRADRPQKGRYREFTQCDVDVIGSDSLLNEVELIRMIDEIFARLGVEVVIKLNNRKVLSGISQYIEAPEMLTDITTAMDKLDKIGIANVVEELKSRGIYASMIDKILPIIELKGDDHARLDQLEGIIGSTADGLQGIAEVRKILAYLSGLQLRAQIEFDQSLARGLNYYTGSIIEVKARDVEIGSVCGGGRYDDLTGIFGLPNISGVGVSFGADRIYDVMNELDLFAGGAQTGTGVLLANFGEKEAAYSLKITEQLMAHGIVAELYPDQAKMKKQMRYADQKGIRYVILIGEEEMQSGLLTLKNMVTGEQSSQGLDELIEKLKPLQES